VRGLWQAVKTARAGLHLFSVWFGCPSRRAGRGEHSVTLRLRRIGAGSSPARKVSSPRAMGQA
jgi:hypothetical protein